MSKSYRIDIRDAAVSLVENFRFLRATKRLPSVPHYKDMHYQGQQHYKDLVEAFLETPEFHAALAAEYRRGVTDTEMQDSESVLDVGDVEFLIREAVGDTKKAAQAIVGYAGVVNVASVDKVFDEWGIADVDGEIILDGVSRDYAESQLAASVSRGVMGLRLARRWTSTKPWMIQGEDEGFDDE